MLVYILASSEAAVGPIALAKNIIKTEGPKGLYRGIAPNFMKVTQSIKCIHLKWILFYFIFYSGRWKCKSSYTHLHQVVPAVSVSYTAFECVMKIVEAKLDPSQF